MVRKTHIAAALALAPVLASLQGCLAVAAFGAAAAGAYYYQGVETRVVEDDPVAVVAASEEVMEEMGLTVEEAASSSLDGQLLARTARDERVQITVEALPAGGSEVTVRVGIADQETAGRILDAIVAELD